MYRKPGSTVPNDILLPEYKLDLYKKGDEKEWVRIALSLGELKMKKKD